MPRKKLPLAKSEEELQAQLKYIEPIFDHLDDESKIKVLMIRIEAENPKFTTQEVAQAAGCPEKHRSKISEWRGRFRAGGFEGLIEKSALELAEAKKFLVGLAEQGCVDRRVFRRELRKAHPSISPHLRRTALASGVVPAEGQVTAREELLVTLVSIIAGSITKLCSDELGNYFEGDACILLFEGRQASPPPTHDGLLPFNASPFLEKNDVVLLKNDWLPDAEAADYVARFRVASVFLYQNRVLLWLSRLQYDEASSHPVLTRNFFYAPVAEKSEKVWFHCADGDYDPEAMDAFVRRHEISHEHLLVRSGTSNELYQWFGDNGLDPDLCDDEMHPGPDDLSRLVGLIVAYNARVDAAKAAKKH